MSSYPKTRFPVEVKKATRINGLEGRELMDKVMNLKKLLLSSVNYLIRPYLSSLKPVVCFVYFAKNIFQNIGLNLCRRLTSPQGAHQYRDNVRGHDCLCDGTPSELHPEQLLENQGSENEKARHAKCQRKG